MAPRGCRVTESVKPANEADPLAPDAAVLPWLVVVGASAGGLEALQAFFGALDAPTNACYVVIQHLAPDHRSLMSELLARHTTLAVQEAEAGQVLLPDHVYLMPSSVVMSLDGDRLAFAPRPHGGVSLPIDHFLLSAAQRAGERGTVAVVLSGSGSDGSAGVSALRKAGGYVLAQSPESAKFDSMPRSVMAATQVDAVLPPAELAARVQAITGGDAARVPGGEWVSRDSLKPALQRLFALLLEQSGIDFSLYKLPTMMRRIERRMVVTGAGSMADYADCAQTQPEELELLRRELLIPVTSFFRDPEAFEALGSALKDVLLRQPPTQPLRLWCAGCATGEEAYTLAMLALEACDAAQRWPGLKVFASDVDARFLAVASAGGYPRGAAEALSAQRLERFFTWQDDRLVVKPELRQMVLFAKHNLLEDAPFTKMDVVVCRNTLIYFQQAAQERVMRRLQYALNPHGLMLLGHSESLGVLQPDFVAVDAASKLYRLVRPVLAGLALRDGFSRPGGAGRARAAGAASPAAAGSAVLEQGMHALLQAYVPLTMLLGQDRQLLHTWGPSERWLRVSSGQASLDVLRMLPSSVAVVVGHAFAQAMREQRDYRAPALPLQHEGQNLALTVVARPLVAGEISEGCVLISLEEQRADVSSTPADERSLNDVEVRRMEMLERELADLRLTLQSTIEEMETANEELQATNEELMSSNEELQSTNEELQSVNEELYTVNAEYNAKLDVVNGLNADLDGMSRATGIATLFVDQQLALVRFTPEATLLFRLRGEDCGRTITDFKCQLDYPELVTDLRQALDQATLVERELAGPGGVRYLARVLGYGDAAVGARRAVLSLIDVSRLRDAERLQATLDAMPEHIAVIDRQGNIVQTNRAWQDFADANGCLGDAGLGANYFAVLLRSTEPGSAEVLQGLQDVLTRRRTHYRITYPCHSPTQQRWFVMHVAPLSLSGQAGAVIAHLDVTAYVEGSPATASLERVV